MENGASAYLSFVRGFAAAARERRGDTASGAAPAGESAADQAPDPSGNRAPDGPPGVDPRAFTEGYTAGSSPVIPTLLYRELSIQDRGRFSGTLDVVSESAGPEPVGGPWDRPLGQSRTEDQHRERDLDRVPDVPAQLSGTLELG